VLSDLLQTHEMKQAGEQSVSARVLARLLHTIRAATAADSGSRMQCGVVLQVYGSGAESR
jgi:hypothetical protein